jgi:hypothetical protein
LTVGDSHGAIAEVTVVGARPGDPVAAAFVSDELLPDGVLLSGAVTDNDIVTVTLFNVFGFQVKLVQGMGSLRADVFQS